MITAVRPTPDFEDYIDKLVRTAAAFAHVPRCRVLAGSRCRYETMARKVVYRFLRELGLSYPVIGYLTGRDHTAVLYEVKKADAALLNAVKVAMEATPKPEPMFC